MNNLKNSNFTTYFALYWAVFWLFNGLDKFVFHSNLGLFIWYGKDRDWQFSVYLTNMNIPTEMVAPILLFAGTLEILLSLIFAIFVAIQLFNKNQAKNTYVKIYEIGIKFSILIFIGFCAFDVVAGDRAELLEHSTYIGILAASYLVSHVEKSIIQTPISNVELSGDVIYKNGQKSASTIVKKSKIESKISNIQQENQPATNTANERFNDDDIVDVLRKYRNGDND